MTFKRAIAIGLLSSAGIGLLFLGIKFGSFNKDNTNTPKHRITSPVIRTDAEDVITPVSNKWLINYNLPYYTASNYIPLGQNAAFFTTRHWSGLSINDETSYYNLQYFRDGTTPTTYLTAYRYLNGQSNSQTFARWYEQQFNWNSIGYRIVNFTNTPTGNLYTWLNSFAKPAYNNDILLTNQQPNKKIITEIRKQNVHINEENYEYNTGTFINTSGTIQLYIDAGCEQLIINGTSYSSNLDGAINITNNDIVIQIDGTPSGNTSHIFTINYFNTREPITPQPYPDPSDTRVEYLDITGLMLQILTMPFTFISTAFNLTIFEGTPYQFNFSNFILSLIAIATLIFIIKLFTSGFSVIGNYTGKVQNQQLTKARINETKSRTALNNRTNPNEKTSHIKTSKE